MKEDKSDIFPQLVHIDNVNPLNESDKPLINELHGVLKKYNALDKYSITLLHKHFNVKDNEALLESTDSETREQELSIIERSKVDLDKNIPSSWRFDV